MNKFEIVRTDAGWHSRFVAASGEIVWTTQVYEAHADAEQAVRLVCQFAPTAELAFSAGIAEVDERTQGS